MGLAQSVARMIAGYRSGMYTRLEIMPGLIMHVSEGEEAELLTLIPSDLLEPFKQWVTDYCLEGGVRIQVHGPTPPLSKAVIINLKRLIAEELPK